MLLLLLKGSGDGRSISKCQVRAISKSCFRFPAFHLFRSSLHARLRTATLRNDFEGQAVLINCLLRNYLHYSLYNQADKLVLKCTFPEQASNSEWAR